MFIRHDLSRRSASGGIGGAAVLLATVLGTAPLAAQTAADSDENGGDDTVVLRNMLPEQFDMNDGVIGYRIVGGFAAKPGAWPSMIVLHDRTFDNGRTPFCGGTIIDTEWVLTAGHCAYHRQAQNLFIRENVNSAKTGGRQIAVRQIIMHESYSPTPPRNDVALLHLAAPARSPRQVLMRDARQADLQKDGTMATIIGYGRVKPQPVDKPQNFDAGPTSEKLLEANLPLVAREKCMRVYNSEWISSATICAGKQEGGVDTCQGDSGGPLFVRDELKQPIQAGVVSWGAGCAQPNKYGIYASVGNFEGWIRGHVPNASFVGASTGGPANSTNGTLTSIVSGPATSNPSQLAQVSVDLLPGERVKVGQSITVRVTSSVPGHLMVVNEESDGRAYQIFPNKFSGKNLPGQARTSIAAGQSTSVPGPMDAFKLTVTPPVGRNRIIAVVVPGNVRIDDLAAKHDDMQPIEDLNGLLEDLFDRMTRGIKVEATAPKNRAVGVREYEIVK